MSAAGWGVVVAIAAVFVGSWFSWRSLKISISNQTDAAMLSMKTQLAKTCATLAADLQSIAHTIRMTRNAPYTFTSVVESYSVDGKVTIRENPGLLWITFGGGDAASVVAKHVTLAEFSKAYERARDAATQVEFASAQYQVLCKRAGMVLTEFLPLHRNTIASMAPVLERLLKGSLNSSPKAEDIDELGDAGLGVPDDSVTELLAAFAIPTPPSITSSDIASRHEWARQMLVDRLDVLIADTLHQMADALALTPRE